MPVIRTGLLHNLKALYKTMFLILRIGASILNNIALSIPPFWTPGAKFSGFRIFLFGLGGPLLSLPQFSFLPYLEVG
jgi:hypothetical protein